MKRGQSFKLTSFTVFVQFRKYQQREQFAPNQPPKKGLNLRILIYLEGTNFKHENNFFKF